jgi:hypothetical protein
MLVLTKKILNMHQSSFLSVLVYGDLGVGKTSYCLKVATEYYMHQGYSKEEAYQKALDCTLFQVKDIVDWFKKHNYKNRAPITILDDASIHLSGKRWQIDSKLLTQFEELLTTGRTSTQVLLINCPDVSGVIGFVREMLNLKIAISKEDSDWQRKAQPYTKYRHYRLLTTRWKKAKWRDIFSCKLPDDVYKKYMRQRDSYKDIALKGMEGKK